MNKFLNIFIDIDTAKNFVNFNIKSSNGHDFKEYADIENLVNTDKFIGGKYIETTSNSKKDKEIDVSYYFTLDDKPFPMGSGVDIQIHEKSIILFSGESGNSFILGLFDGSAQLIAGILAAICFSDFDKAEAFRGELINSFEVSE